MIRFFTAHPTIANILMIGFLVLGALAAPTLLRETFPRIDPRYVQVSVTYPGGRAEDIEDAICGRIEDAVDAVSDVEEVVCEASEGRGVAKIEMVEGADLSRFLADVKNEVEAIKDFPENTEAPVIRQLGRTDAVASVAITGPENPTELKALAEEFKRRMLQWGGIPQIEIAGFSDHQIRIEIRDAVMRQLGLSMADVATAIKRQSLDLPSGELLTGDEDILIRFADERRRVDEFASLVIASSPQGGRVTLGDIAHISDRFDKDEERVLFNGRRAALLNITKTEKEDTLRVIDAVSAFVAAAQKTAPPGVRLQITNDGSSIVRDRLQLLITNGWQGLVLVFLALWLFFGLRYSFWVTMGLPVSFAGALAVMAMIGFSINMLTMVALLIVIGLLMDDAIVIAENIAAKYQRGRNALEAAVHGAKQVLPGVLSSFFTTVCIFGSLAFLKGDLGAVLRVVPIVMMLVLVVSLVEAFLILPRHLHHALEHSAETPSFIQVKTEAAVEYVRRRLVGPLVERAVRWRYLTLGSAVGLLMISAAMLAGGVLKFSAFPSIDGDAIEARILLPQGTPLKRTSSVVDLVNAALERVNKELSPAQPKGQALIRNVAVTFNKNQDAGESGAHVATIAADLLSAEIRTSSNDEIFALWRKYIGHPTDVLNIKLTEPFIGPAGIAFDFKLKGANLHALKAASRQVQARLKRYKGVRNVMDDLRPGKTEVRIRLKESAKSFNVDARQVADQLRGAFFGTTVSEIQRGRESYEIDVRLDSEDRNSLADLDRFNITLAGGTLVPLSAIASISQGRGFARITRVDGVRTVSVQGDVDVRFANANAIINDMKKNFFPQLGRDHPEVRIEIEGQDKNAATTQKSMVQGFATGLIGVFLLLSFQFRSYIEPLVVMIVIPFAFIGVVWGHLLMGLEFTMPSMLGFVAMAGIVVNDSILLVNFIKDHHTPGMAVAEAAPLAAKARFRAIFLTSATTIAGLIPVLSETSPQAQILVPLVTSLAFGLLASTVLVLFVVPAFYSILDDFGFSTLSES
ncbi:MAG: AcrB/AcrD/AcrF family protein [Hyphomicrobiales bacterium]|nr:MAG: AcrB/AcrD/AcrF family protein [Hyphomicrobiales bacterium]